MKKSYTTPSVSVWEIDDVLANSDLDNIGQDPADEDGFDNETSWLIQD